MALRTIGDANESSNDLPWCNEYLDQGGTEGDASFVRQVKKGANGYLILAEDFKGFLFAKSAIAKYLAEALDVWVSNSSVNYPLYAVVAKGGKLNLAVDDAEPPSVWIEETKNKSWEQKPKKERGGSSRPSNSNPFLPTPPPTTRGKGKRSEGEHPDQNAMPY